MLSAIYLYEVKQLLRSKSFIAITAIVFAIGIYAIVYGRNEVNEQNRKIELLEHKIDSSFSALAISLQTHDTTANTMGEFLGRAHVNRPDGMAAMSFGQRDIHKFAQQITNGSYFYNKYASGYGNKTMSGEIVNPFKLMSGNLDLGFVLLLIFPLYAILLCYNILSAEGEGGTLNLLRMQPVNINRIIFHKLLLRLLIITGLGVLLLIIAGIVNEILFNARWWLYTSVFIAYIVCWTGIISTIIAIRKSSGFNALAMVSAWLLFTLLLPSLLNTVLNNMKPVLANTELAAAVQKANAEVWALPKQVKTDSFKTVRPYYAHTFDTIGSWDDPKFYRVNHYLTDYYIRGFEEKRVQKLVIRNAFGERLNYFSPALLVQSSFNELAAGNMDQMLAYDTTAFTYFLQISRFTDDRIFLQGNRFSGNDLRNMPLHAFKPKINFNRIAFSILILVNIGILLTIISFKNLSINKHLPQNN